MATINITDQDRADAATFLQEFLSEAVPKGDFSKGSYLYDMTISALAYTVAYLRAEARLALDRSSVKRIFEMADTVDRDEAADDALSNWFLTRKSGRPSRGKIRVYVSQKTDVLVPVTTRFFYDSAHAYIPDYTQAKVVPAGDIVDVIGSDASVIAQYFELSVVSNGTGAGYDVQPARWLSWDSFSPYVTKVESVEAFAGGATVESTDAFLARAKDAVSTRDLTTARAIRAVLMDTFATVDDVYVAGAGAPEMLRDLTPPYAGFTQFHTGGFTDVYVKGAAADASVYEATVGATFTEDRLEVVNFTATDIANFTTNVTPGMVVKIYDNPDSSDPDAYVIQEVHPKYIVVDDRNPFPAVRSPVQFSIGTNYPDFNNVYSQRSTGSCTRDFKLPQTVKLPALPIYLIKKVTWYDVSTSTWIPLTRNIYTVAEQPALGTREYRVYYADPQYAFSGYQVALVECGSDVVDGDTLRVEYESIPGIDAVHSYVSDTYNRTSCANTLVRAMFPVYVRFDVKYKLIDATDTLTSEDIVLDLVSFINNFPATEELHVSKIAGHLMSTWGTRLLYATPCVGNSLFTVAYDLHAPNGAVISYSTQGGIQVTPAVTDLVTGAISSNETERPLRLPNPLTLSISKNNIMYLTSASLLTATAE